MHYKMRSITARKKKEEVENELLLLLLLLFLTTKGSIRKEFGEIACNLEIKGDT